MTCAFEKRMAACLFAVALLSVSALADSRPSGFHVHSEGWTFVPVITQSGGTTSVPGVLALRYKPDAMGDNIVAVWYTNPGAAGTDWTSKAWTSSDQAKAISYAAIRSKTLL
jgi:hypothetical protein